jgi:FkbM family methyltransferase
MAAGAIVARIIAYEPNANAHAVLARNLARLPVPGDARLAGVGREPGQGSLHQPDFSAHAHSAFVAAGNDFPIERLDDLALTGPVVIKLDVEGGELAALQGAIDLLRQAPRAAVIFEAHIRQADRIGQDPSEILRWLQAIRPWTFEVLDMPGLIPDPDRPFFEQIHDPQPIGYNVLALSH